MRTEAVFKKLLWPRGRWEGQRIWPKRQALQTREDKVVWPGAWLGRRPGRHLAELSGWPQNALQENAQTKKTAVFFSPLI
jgi:hypothetical protein